MTGNDERPPLGYTPAPLEHHTVSIAFDVQARSAQEAEYLVRETLIEELAAPAEALVTDGERVYGEDFGEDAPSIRSWIPIQDIEAAAPADLLAWQVLRALVEDGHVVLDRGERDHLAKIVAGAERDVVVPDPERAGAPPIYEGPASEAHRWIPAGVYAARSLDDPAARSRLVVGAGLHGDTASTAFTVPEHDAAALDRIFFLIEGIKPAEMSRALHAINTVLAFTGRPSADLDLLPKNPREPDPLLRGLLAYRQELLDDDHTGRSHPDQSGPGRSL